MRLVNIVEVISNWEKKPYAVLFSDGPDALLQENGHTKEDAVSFSNKGCSFFED